MDSAATPPADSASPRARLASACIAIAVAGVFTAVAIVTAGGGVARLRFASVGLTSPWLALGVGIVFSWCAWWLSRPAATPRSGASPAAPSAGPRVAAVALALCAALVSWAYGTESAAGADASGYLNAAKLFASGSVGVAQPLAADAPWPDALPTMAPLGFRPGPAPDTIVPTYPPGLPLVLAVAMRVHANGWTVVVPAFAALSVIATFLVGTRVGSTRAALLGACGVASSPVFLFHAIQPMSDVPTTAWWTLALACALRRSPRYAAASGLCTSAAILTRPNLAPIAVAVLAVALLARRGRVTAGTDGAADDLRAGARAARRPQTVAALAYVAATLPGVAAVAWLNTRMYGHPLVSGYGSAGELFSLSSVPLNATRYAGWLADVHPFASFAALVSVALFAWRRRADAPGGARAPVGTRPLVVALTGVVVLNVGAYLVYAPFENWTYLRFLLPAFPLAALAASSLLDRAVTRAGDLAPAVARAVPRALATAALCGAIAGLGIRESAARGVFERRAIDARHELIARAYTPRAATTVFVTQQHGGAVRFHLGATVVRWDLIEPAALDHAMTWMAARGLAPVILLDADEEPVFRERFSGRGAWAALDWPARFETGPPQRARSYELEDRARFESGEPVRPTLLPR